MKLPAIPVTSFEDATLNAERLQLLLASMNAITWGSVTLTWPGASNNTDQPTVTHGLGRTPKTVLVAPGLTSAGGFCSVCWENVTATTFQVFGTNWGVGGTPALGTTATCYWAAIG